MQRLSLISYDVLRELCDACSRERFHFVPQGANPSTGECRHCGATSKLADMTDTSVWRLVTHANGDVVIIPMAAQASGT